MRAETLFNIGVAIFIHFVCLTLASPIRQAPTSSNKTLLPRNKAGTLEELTNEFKGIHWDRAFKDCSPEQLDHLIYATRAAMWMLELPHSDKDFQYSAAWERYFGKYLSWLDQGVVYSDRATGIVYNIKQVGKYAKEGHPKRTVEAKRVHYSCSTDTIRDSYVKCKRGTAAVTSKPDKIDRWAIVFCPTFFDSPKLDFLERRVKKRLRSDILVGFLDTYERTIIHEFMHVDMFGLEKPHIGDVKADMDGYKQIAVYGEDRCRQFARLYGKKPNIDVSVNADTYSWFFHYYYFDKKQGWSSPPHNELKKVALTAEEFKALNSPKIKEEDVPPPDFPVSAGSVKYEPGIPRNCYVLEEKDSKGIPITHCDYVGDYNEWVIDIDKPSKSDGGCELSPQCKRTMKIVWADPECKCKCDGQTTPLSDPRCDGYLGVAIPSFNLVS